MGTPVEQQFENSGLGEEGGDFGCRPVHTGGMGVNNTRCVRRLGTM